MGEPIQSFSGTCRTPTTNARVEHPILSSLQTIRSVPTTHLLPSFHYNCGANIQEQAQREPDIASMAFFSPISPGCTMYPFRDGTSDTDGVTHFPAQEPSSSSNQQWAVEPRNQGNHTVGHGKSWNVIQMRIFLGELLIASTVGLDLVGVTWLELFAKLYQQGAALNRDGCVPPAHRGVLMKVRYLKTPFDL